MDPLNLELIPDMVSMIAQELTFARTKIKEMENQAKLLQNRTDAAEYALRVMAKNFEEISGENHRLTDSLAELTDSKTGIKQETVDGTIAGNSPDPKQLGGTASTELASFETNETDDVPALQQALELYYQKYKAQKEAKRQLRDEFDELKAETEKEKGRLKQALRVSENRAKKAQAELRQTSSNLENEKEWLKEAMQKLDERTKADAAKPTILSTQKDVEKFMSEHPKPIKCLPHEQLDPVCLTSLDLKAYIECDTNVQQVGTNFLCLPDRIVWCLSERVHALALGPMYLQDHPGSPWRRSCAFDGLYGKAFHLFYTEGTFVFYAGLYKAIDLRKQCPEGISTKQCPEETQKILADLTTQSKKLVSDVTKLYTLGALQVEPLGLQCIEFDIEIYNSLHSRFTPVQSAINLLKLDGKRKGYYPEDHIQQRPMPSKRTRKK